MLVPTTTLRFDLPEVSNLTLTIYNMLGQKIRTYDMQSTPAGHQDGVAKIGLFNGSDRKFH